VVQLTTDDDIIDPDTLESTVQPTEWTPLHYCSTPGTLCRPYTSTSFSVEPVSAAATANARCRVPGNLATYVPQNILVNAVRLVQTTPNSNKNCCLCLSGIEFYGEVVLPACRQCFTCYLVRPGRGA
jgi:hypothetical protein